MVVRVGARGGAWGRVHAHHHYFTASLQYTIRLPNMCGILFFHTRGMSAEDVQVLREHHVPLLRHRGPDCTECLEQTDAEFLMGFHRLSVINTASSGMQPFTSADGGTFMVFSGEVYNWRALAALHGVDAVELRSDADILLRMGETTAPLALVPQLDGDFAVAVARSDGSFWAARDHVGVRPLFYGVSAQGAPIAFASEAKALVGAPNVGAIHVFPPGTVYQSSTREFTPYRPIPIMVSDAPAVTELLTEAVRKRVEHSDVPVGVLCSGGVDSAIITLLAVKYRPNLRVFTMQFDDGFSEDAFYAQLMCEKAGLQHTIVRFNARDAIGAIGAVVKATETYDPITIRAAIPMYLLAKYISECTDIKVVLSGEGADELFAGYSYFTRANHEPTLVHAETQNLLSKLHMFDLLRADRCFAAHGLEVRVPFLDSDLVAHVSSLNPALLATHNEKQLLRDAFRDGLDCIPRIIDRPKQRFSDGCGFSYVPLLLRHHGGEAVTLEDRLACEKQAVMEAFDALYPGCRGLIAPRTMPAWATSPAQEFSPAIGWASTVSADTESAAPARTGSFAPSAPSAPSAGSAFTLL
jgi:asparagine synthase (glutamine-hydrolysing)